MSPLRELANAYPLLEWLFGHPQAMALIIGGVPALTILFFVANAATATPKMDLADKHVMITGGSQGIGKAVAVQCAQLGANVTLVARKKGALEEAKKEVLAAARTAGFNNTVVEVCSVDCAADFGTVQKAIDAVVDAVGTTVDVLVNCAGTSLPGNFEELDPATFERLMRINYLGSVYPTRAVVPAMKQHGQGGRVVFVSSQAGQLGVFGFSAYSPTKFAIVGLAQVLRMELKAHDIYVSVAYPPDTDTPGFAEENKTKPEECRLISETAGLFSAQQVAKDIVRGLQRGQFSIYSGIDGWMLAHLTAGMGPVSSLLEAAMQVALMSLFRLISLFYLMSFDHIVYKCKNKREAAAKKAQ